MSEVRLTSRTLIRELGSMRKQILRFIDETNPKYADFGRILLEKNYFDGQGSYPSMQELAERCSLNNSKIRKYLLDMYGDCKGAMVHRFPKLRITFSMSFLDRFVQIDVEGLTHLPRVGENFSMPFFRDEVMSEYMYVDEISHYFTDDEHRIDLSLKVGRYEPFWKIRKDEALLKGELSWRDMHETDSILKKKLGYRD